MATKYDVVQIAFGEVGNTSGRKYWNWYYGGNWEYQDGYSTPYCACFVSWVLAQAGAICPCFPDSCAFDERCDFQGRYVDKYSLEPGDVVAFDWDGDVKGDHVGIVTGTFDGGVYTVEGNTSGGVVTECTRYYSSIICGVRPYYEDAASTGKLDVDGWCGPKTITRWQEILGFVNADGVISGQDTEYDQYREHIVSINRDGDGSLLVTKIQKIISAHVDGQWGRDTSNKLQQYLINHGYSCGEWGADGYFGPASARALQKSINDGLW